VAQLPARTSSTTAPDAGFDPAAHPTGTSARGRGTLPTALVRVVRPDDRARPDELLLDDRTLGPTSLALAAARAGTVRLRHGAALPTRAAVRALVAMLAGEIAAAGRDRRDVRMVLEVEVVVADDEADAVRRRTNLALSAAFSHATWHADTVVLVAPVGGIGARARELAAEVGVDQVDLVLVGGTRTRARDVVASLRAMV